MPDWTKSMTRTFEYYIVDPGTWKDVRKLDYVKSCTISRDSEADTLGSATIDVTEMLGECYVRVYLITIQNGIKEKFPLGTYLVQTQSPTFNGKVNDISLDAYTPLLELKENPPPIGYALLKGDNIMKKAYLLTIEHLRAPVVETKTDDVLYNDFISNTDDTWVTFVKDLIANAKHKLDLDEMGRVLFAPDQDTASLQPVWTFNDGNSSILYPDLTNDHDLYGIPNVVEVIYSNDNVNYYARVVNNDESSPISTVNRGREITYRDTNPSLIGNPTEKEVQEYAKKLLRSLSTLEYTISFTHGYCPVRLGDCVRLNYEGAGLIDVKAKIISQSIKCTSECPVTAKATYSKRLWG